MNYNSIVMEYQNIINLLDSTQNQPTKFTTKSWVEINGESRWMYNIISQIGFKTSILVKFLNYSNAYILVKGTIMLMKMQCFKIVGHFLAV